MIRRTIDLPAAKVLVEVRRGFLYVREKGRLRDEEDVARYARVMERLFRECGVRRALIDAREEDRGDRSDPAATAAMWRWLRSDRSFSRVAFVLSDEMAVARVNMTALSDKLALKAFGASDPGAVQRAQRWLMRDEKGRSLYPPTVASEPPPPDDPTSGR